MATKATDQLALDERQIDDKTLEGLLEARLQAAQDKAEVSGVFKKADEAAKAAISLLSLEDEDAVRIGRFRITKNVRVLIAARAAGRPLPSGPGCGLEIPVGRRHIEKAWAILHGADTAIARGPKVEALAANLAGDMSVTTVDRHITMIATGGESRQVKPSELRRIGVTLSIAARARDIEPAVMMAALWLRRNRVRGLARIAG